MAAPLRLFTAYGVELEYMIVDRESLDVRPIADELLRDAAGTHEFVGEVDAGDFGWSNELVAHVVELKTAGPAAALDGLASGFSTQVRRINELLAPRGARLMPGGMHPWMDPARETKLWRHESSEVYETFHRIFDCRGHGWSNLQSVHLNLPFGDDEEFGRLHAAIRLVLPILPALAAASPIVEARISREGEAPVEPPPRSRLGGSLALPVRPPGSETQDSFLDARLNYYRQNCRRIPSVTGRVVPEPVFTAADYQRAILGRIYDDVTPLDPGRILRHEWLNARGAIARFERNTIEIRVLDTQECPAADLAICGLAVATIRALVEERFRGFDEQQMWPTERLEAIFLAAIKDGERAIVDDAEFLRAFGVIGNSTTLGELWQHIDESLGNWAGKSAEARCALELIHREGPLARRILTALGGGSAGVSPSRGRGASTGTISREQLREVYGRLCDCLARGKSFLP
ncbi:MAG: glutamate--cysteine ligase [Planctomycetia bacterium]|nr:glutamate--cysteine ligase [Planctomycetia bacterium]